MALAALVSCGVVFYPGASGASPQPASAAVEAPLSSSFLLLREAANGEPPVEVANAVAHAPSSFGLDLGAARRAGGSGVWLIPGEGELCLATEDPEGLGMSCASASAAENGGLALLERSANGGVSTLVGAAPDGDTRVLAHAADGSTTGSASIQENTYVVSGQGIMGATPAP
jgi:hypothetical protein